MRFVILVAGIFAASSAQAQLDTNSESVETRGLTTVE